MINYEEWLCEVKSMDRNLDSKEKMKVWGKYAWNKPIYYPPRRTDVPIRHFGGEHDGEIIKPKSSLLCEKPYLS